jgi:hypothetical protein
MWPKRKRTISPQLGDDTDAKYIVGDVGDIEPPWEPDMFGKNDDQLPVPIQNSKRFKPDEHVDHNHEPRRGDVPEPAQDHDGGHWHPGDYGEHHQEHNSALQQEHGHLPVERNNANAVEEDDEGYHAGMEYEHHEGYHAEYYQDGTEWWHWDDGWQYYEFHQGTWFKATWKWYLWWEPVQ